MKILNSKRKKALLIIDVQPAFIDKRNNYIIDNIIKLIKKVSYEEYIVALFHAEKDSIWDKQQKWACPKDDNFRVSQKLQEVLDEIPHSNITKETKSIFKGNQNLSSELKNKGIEEVHIVGADTNDCVLASAYEAFDLGFFSYIIEECCQASSSEEMHLKAIDILRHQNQTNNSCKEDIDVIEIK